MHGSSWFEPDGQWASWDITERLGQIGLPTLVIGGVRDQVVPELARQIHTGIPGSTLVILDAAHLLFFECPEMFLDLIGNHIDHA